MIRKTSQFLIGLVLLFMIFGCSANNATEVPTLTNTPLPTLTPTITPTETPKPTRTPVPTPSPIYVTLGSPFAADCGDGAPRIWSNDSFNGPFDLKLIDDNHGHVDIIVPKGCDAYNIIGELVAPVSGVVSFYPVGDSGDGLSLMMNAGEYILGIEEALFFAGIENPKVEFIDYIHIDMGHVMNVITGAVEKGQPIGDLSNQRPIDDNIAIGYQIFVIYNGVEYALSPTLFPTDGLSWICASHSPHDCVAEPHDYP